jgi:SOS-response transcriptional repressor LexA
MAKQPRFTDKQNNVLSFIKEFITKNGYPPSVRQIGIGVQLKSSATIQRYLIALRDHGLISWVPGGPRTIKVIETERQPSPIEQAIRDFDPTTEQVAGFEALLDWLESTTSFEREVQTCTY